MKNKRNLLLLPLLLLPVVGLTVAFATYKEVSESESNKLWSVLTSFIPGGPMLYCLATVVLVVIFIVMYTKQPHTDEERAATLLFIKVTHLIAGAVVYFSILAYANMRGIEVSNYFKEWLLFSLLLSGCFGFFLLLWVAKSTRVRTGWVFLVSILQFIFVLDALSALLLWLRIKKSSRDAGEVESELTVPAETGEEIAPTSLPKKKGLRRLRFLLLLPGIYLPYSLVVMFITLNNAHSPTGQRFPYQELILLATLIATIPLNLLYVITGFALPNAAEKMVRANMVVRLLQIPGYLINFFFATILMTTIFTFVMSFFLAIFNMMCLLATSVLGAGMVASAVKEGKIPVRTAFFTSVFNYIYCLDVVYAIVLFLYLLIKRISKKPSGWRFGAKREPCEKSAFGK